MLAKICSRGVRRQLAEHIAELMANLGDHPLLVAHRLAESGVTGVRAHPEECAISSYLWAIVGGEPGVRSIDVRGRTVTVQLSGWWRWVGVDVPPPVRAFIAAFDANRFPELVREKCAQHADSPRIDWTEDLAGWLVPGSRHERR